MTSVVLVVEDTLDNRQIIRDLLESANFDVLEAMDGAAGLAMAADHSPDLIIMDIQMAVMDGLEATRRLKADASLRHIPVIAVTSFAMSGDERRCRAAGCDAFTSKPFSPRQLLSLVRQHMPASTADH